MAHRCLHTFIGKRPKVLILASYTFLYHFVRKPLTSSSALTYITSALIKGFRLNPCGPGSVVGIATAYGLDGPGIESRWGEIFRTSPDRP